MNFGEENGKVFLRFKTFVSALFLFVYSFGRAIFGGFEETEIPID